MMWCCCFSVDVKGKLSLGETITSFLQMHALLHLSMGKLLSVCGCIDTYILFTLFVIAISVYLTKSNCGNLEGSKAKFALNLNNL